MKNWFNVKEKHREKVISSMGKKVEEEMKKDGWIVVYVYEKNRKIAINCLQEGTRIGG